MMRRLRPEPWWEPWAFAVFPEMDVREGSRCCLRFMNGETLTLVALTESRFRPLVWRLVWRLLVEMAA